MTAAARVLFVCAGNTCRSPMAEQLLRARISGWRFEISSAGIRARPGERMSPQAFVCVRNVIGLARQHRARVLTPSSVKDAGLVLAATRDIRARIVNRIPVAASRTFTILEFARLVRVVQANPQKPAADRFDAIRVRTRGDRRDDVDDPIGRGVASYRRACAELDAAAVDIAWFFARFGETPGNRSGAARLNQL